MNSLQHPNWDQARREGWRGRSGWLAVGALLLGSLSMILAGCTAAGSEGGALQRGDEAFARGDYSEALAEYRLVLRQGRDEVEVLTRTAHTYAQLGRIDDAGELYRRAVLREPGIADLAAADLLRVARRASESRRDGMLAAAAVNLATELRPGVSLTGLARPLADHFARQGQYGRALPYYQKAVAEVGQDPILILEMARAHEELGDCELALTFLEQIEGRVSADRASEVDWRIGQCSFEMGRLARDEKRLDDALEYFGATIEKGEPRNRVAQAWYQVGEILAESGRCMEALRAFERVRDEELAGGALADRARDRIDEIRFPRGRTGPC
jgi:tetratricopeptide (TPR) repeat protein